MGEWLVVKAELAMKLLFCACLFLWVDLLAGETSDCERTYYLSKTADDKLNVSFNNSASLSSQEFTHLSEFLDELQFLDCDVSLFLYPGVYALYGSSNISLNELVTIKSINDSLSAQVTVACQQTTNAGLKSKPQLLFAGSPTSIQGTVHMEGIAFHSCAYSIRFNYLDRLEIHNCIFRYVFMIVVYELL